jgi:hypothetical protein
MSKSPLDSAYRSSAALACASCGVSAGEDYTFTTSGDVQCRRCADADLHATASMATSRSGADFAGERLCPCGGVASAGQIVNVQRVDRIELAVDSRALEMGSETVFTCASCGKTFALLNRLRRVRLAVRALKFAALGLAVGLLALAIVQGVLGILAFTTTVLVFFGIGAAPLRRDLLLRRAYPSLG